MRRPHIPARFAAAFALAWPLLASLPACSTHRQARPPADETLARSQTEPAPTRVLTPTERRKVERLYQLGIEAASEQRNEEAARYWELAWTIDPDHPHVAERLRSEHLALGMEAWADERIDDAIAHWNAVLRVIPGDERARGYIRRAYELDARLKEIVRESELAESDESSRARP